MRSILLRNFVKPLVERLGTMLAAFLIARGLDADMVAQLLNAVVAAMLVGVDLLISAVNRNAQPEGR